MKDQDNRPDDAAGLRQRAEEIARKKTSDLPENLADLSPAETRRALHELRVHQIELEMQNEELRRAQAELDAERARYFDLYDLAPVGYCTLSEQGLVLKANLTAATLLGVARGMMVSQPFSQFILREDQDRYYRHRKKLFQTSEPQTDELRLRKADGTAFWARLEAVVAQDADGARACRVVLSDVSATKQLEEELRAARDAADAANSAKGEFLATMSHEIRTPMNAILNLTALTLRTELSPEQRDYLDSVRQSSANLLAIINDILDFSKIEAGGVELDSLDFDLPEIVASTVRTMSARTELKNLFLRLEINPATPRWVKGDPGRLRQVLINLIGNAKKFTETGGITVCLGVEPPAPKTAGGQDGQGDSPAHRVTFSVADTGIGIPADKQRSIFDMFSQADSSTSRCYGGSGLGLAISRRLVETMGGSLNVVSEPGTGSTFTFGVRLAPGAEAAPRRPETLKACASGLRILVAEDNHINAKVAKAFLGKLGYQAEVVPSGDRIIEGVRAAREAGAPFDLVFMDVEMPEMDGFETTQALRGGAGGEADKDIPIVAMTAHALGGFRERCMVAGMDHYVSKPVDFGKLPKVIARVLAMKRQA